MLTLDKLHRFVPGEPSSSLAISTDKLRTNELLKRFKVPDSARGAYWYEQVDKLLKEGILVNASLSNGATVLGMAIDSNMPDLVLVALLDQGADVGTSTLAGDSLVVKAVKAGVSLTVIAKMLSKSDVVNLKDRFGTPLLLIAMDYNREDVAIAIVKANALVNVPDRNGRFPLEVVISKRLSVELVIALLERNAFIERCSPNDLVSIGIKHNVSDEVLAVFIENALGLDKKLLDDTILLSVVQVGVSVGVLKKLVEYGADVDAVDILKNTPLHFAYKRKVADEIISFLVESGANQSVRNEFGSRPIDFLRRDESSVENNDDVLDEAFETHVFAAPDGGVYVKGVFGQLLFIPFLSSDDEDVDSSPEVSISVDGTIEGLASLNLSLVSDDFPAGRASDETAGSGNDNARKRSLTPTTEQANDLFAPTAR
ncbi:hypothetical protein HOH87_01165 [bacterium]|jgi:ankyrin repeat protein|nr:hypothetical protein [bacterium]